MSGSEKRRRRPPRRGPLEADLFELPRRRFLDVVDFVQPHTRILVWMPGRRVVFQRSMHPAWLFMLWPILVLAGWPAVEWAAELMAYGWRPLDRLWEDFLWQWQSALWLLIPLGLALAISLWVGWRRRSEIDWVSGVARGLGSRESPLSVVEAVRLREYYSWPDEVDDPYVFKIELLPKGGEALPVAHFGTIADSRRESLHRALVPLAQALAASLGVPYDEVRPRREDYIWWNREEREE